MYTLRVYPRGRRSFPGHNKWDYAYSVGTEHPDVIVQTWRATPADVRLIRSFGYEPLAAMRSFGPAARTLT
jgi:hypothetical protein